MNQEPKQLEFDFDDKKKAAKAINTVNDENKKPNIVGKIDLEARRREEKERKRKERDRIRIGDNPALRATLLKAKENMR